MMNLADLPLRRIFTIVAAMNFVVGFGSMLLPRLHLQMFYNIAPETVDNTLLLYHQMFWAVVVTLGIAYLIMAQNPRGHQGILFIGAVGKLIAAIVWIYALARGFANPIVLGGIAWDGSWGIFFAVLLWQYYREGSSTLVFLAKK